ncbi:MAG TPA: kelch repeat-containing protein, partial [bacterium]|nr:kelch repeat-containing protein [bacterium]
MKQAIGLLLVVGVLFGLGNVVPASAEQWQALPSYEVGRRGHTAVYDGRVDRMVVFAGQTSNGYVNSCLQMNLAAGSEAWSGLSPSGEVLPSPRAFHTAIVYPTRNMDAMIVFGGMNQVGRVTNYFNDLWALSMIQGSEAWNQIDTKGTLPAVRESHSAIYDPGSATMIVFGGRNGTTYFDDLWVFDFSSSSWALHANSGKGPTSRAGHSAVYDAAKSRMLVYGGYTSSGAYLDELWALDLTAVDGEWKKLSPSGKGYHAVAWHSAVFDDNGTRMLLFGGTDGMPRNYLQCLSFTTDENGEWVALNTVGTVPVARNAFPAVLDPKDERMVLFGGVGSLTPYLGSTHELNWRIIATATPTRTPTRTATDTAYPTITDTATETEAPATLTPTPTQPPYWYNEV